MSDSSILIFSESIENWISTITKTILFCLIHREGHSREIKINDILEAIFYCN